MPSMPWRGPAERVDEVGGEIGVDQLDVLVQRAVAEQHVDRLRRVVTGGERREANADAEAVGIERLDARDAAHHVLAHPGIAHDVRGHFDALLQRERGGGRLDVGGGRADVVGDVDPGHGLAASDPSALRRGVGVRDVTARTAQGSHAARPPPGRC